MYYCESGKTLLKLYNQKNDKNVTMEEFFYNVFVPLFYGEGKMLMHVSNSPFNQPSHKNKPLEFKVDNFKNKIEEGKTDASIFVGGPAEKSLSATRTQFEDIYFKISKEQIYQSWIGNALSLMVNGGYCISINDEELIWLIYEGWYKYKELVTSDFKISENKINSWNTVWVVDKMDIHKPSDMLDYSKYLELDKTTGFNRFRTQFWGKTLFSISRVLKTDMIITYVYQLGQQNKTIGFVPIKIRDNRRLISLYIDLFGKNNYIKNKDRIEEIYGSYYKTFDRVCEHGVIGFKSLKPEYKQIKNNKDTLEYHTYKMWLMELLNINGKNYSDLIDNVAEYLISFSNRTTKTMKKGNSEKGIFVDDFLSSRTQTKLIEKLGFLSGEDPDSKVLVSALTPEVLTMNRDSISILMNLIKITYNNKI